MNDLESLSGDQIEDGEGNIEDRITKTVRFKEGGGLNSVTEVTSVINGIPGIEFSDRIKKILVRDMESAVVVKLLGPVVVDLEKPLTSQLRVNGRLQRMKFEALPE
ncbi:hypothetical protein Golax_003906, partial [Gossypium laxum]|nr:hypothetical protein [Gossypium laxum]